MRRSVEFSVSLTETQQFRRLIDFTAEVLDHAREVGDEALEAKVQALSDDLVDMQR